MRKKKGKKINFRRGGDRHGRAIFGTGYANLLENGGLVKEQCGTVVPLHARAVPRFWSS